MVSLPRWKQVLCSFAAVLLLVGVGMQSVLLVRDGLLSPQTGSTTRMLNPAPGGRGPEAPDASVEPREAPPKTKTTPAGVEAGEPGEKSGPDAASETPGTDGRQPQSALVEPAAASSPRTSSRTSNDQNTPAAATEASSPAPSPASSPGLDEDLLKEWSPAFLKGGLGFFVAFLIGFALQAFARLFALFLGLFCLGVLSLASLGWITIEWQVAQQQFQALPGVLATQFSGFQSFLQGALPSIGMAGLGLFAGLKKK